jgi:hypothetical protein
MKYMNEEREKNEKNIQEKGKMKLGEKEGMIKELEGKI